MEIKETWWLMYCSFPNLNWARLQVLETGQAKVLDMDGITHQFVSEKEAKYLLDEDEFIQYSNLDKEDESEYEIDLTKILPPKANNDKELIKLMYVKNKKV